jgi:hypothetical protein
MHERRAARDCVMPITNPHARHTNSHPRHTIESFVRLARSRSTRAIVPLQLRDVRADKTFVRFFDK